ncbi:GNAT family N-acetyltransferase [Amycolatopsis sp. FBCC-B4732]|uniref:GNAT family N-acetyltransferase n=1 Tax=Amycolatopsis sp. FBCC-B4732 TaxID=3079339 RepID=UPI001FF120B4|nr:GNAT family N-acetyltransferase [Amycolatopsis sp. FBCC-B4732]UOX87726.1 GNAT family N-acetyltransferase [Amycolatopsis sp. FBCC-B4732]
MRFTFHDPRADPAPAGWAEFSRAARLHPVWDYGVMGLEAWGARNPQLLVVAADGDALVAAVSVLVCRPRLAPRFAPRPGKRLLRPFWAEVCQPWLSGYPGIAFAPGVRDHAALVREFERELGRHLGPGLLGVVHRALGEELATGLAGRGRLVKRVDPVAVLENRFESEEDWIASLSKSRRAGLRRQRRRLAEDPSLVIRGGAGRTDLDGAELAGLIQAHRERYGRLALDTRTPPSAGFLDRFVRRPDVHTLTYTGTGGQLLAVQTMLDHPDTPVLQHWAALPPAAGGKKWLYFDSYVRAVRFTAKRGARELSAGRGMIELKQELGFRPRPVYTAAVPRPVLGR